MVFFVPDIAFGNHTCKLPKNAGNFFGPHIIFIFTRTNPTQFVIKESDNSLYIIFTIVFVKQKAGCFLNSLYLFLFISRLLQCYPLF